MLENHIGVLTLGLLGSLLTACSSGMSSRPSQDSVDGALSPTSVGSVSYQDVVSAFDAAYTQEFQIVTPPEERELLAICRGDRGDPFYPVQDPKPDDVGELGWQIDTCGGLANTIGEKGTDAGLRARQYLVLLTENTVIPALVEAGRNSKRTGSDRGMEANRERASQPQMIARFADWLQQLVHPVLAFRGVLCAT